MKLLWFKQEVDTFERSHITALFKMDEGHALIHAVNGNEWTDGWEGETSTDFVPEGTKDDDEDWALDLQGDLYSAFYGGNEGDCTSEEEKTPEIEAIIKSLIGRYRDF